MPRDFVECRELTGKIIECLRVYNESSEDCEVLIEFTDGTTFSCSIEQRTAVKSIMFRGGEGTPDVLKDFSS